MYSTGEMVKSTLKYMERSLFAPAHSAQARAGAREIAMDPAAGRAYESSPHFTAIFRYFVVIRFICEAYKIF